MKDSKTPSHYATNKVLAQRNAIAPDMKQFQWQRLTSEQVTLLEKNGNYCDNWDNILVTNTFDPSLIRNSSFYGIVRIADLKRKKHVINGLEYATGITGCTIVNSDIGCYCVLHNIGRMENYIVGNECVITNVCEIVATPGTTFGGGVEVKAMNEGGKRGFTTFPDMLPADAYLQCKYLGNTELHEKLQHITAKANERQPRYGQIHNNCLIRNTKTLENTILHKDASVVGATKVSNVTVYSSPAEPSHIGDGVIIENCLVGHMCKILENSLVQNCLLDDNVTIEHGARVINTMVSDNSTIACCEVQSCMLFPMHEQHHNNSFLIASTILGQSNIAAGATIGSNHNSRSACGEILAGRGFWPGLCTSFKHTSRFASFVLVAKGDYQHELNIPLPFSLVNNNLHTDELEVMPAYWWMYNMYALKRNDIKFQKRDRRIEKRQSIETHFLAPDTVEEIIVARTMLEHWVGATAVRNRKTRPSARHIWERGRDMLRHMPERVDKLEIFANGMENSHRNVRVLKVTQAHHAYGEMLLSYAVSTVLDYWQQNPELTWDTVKRNLRKPERVKQWVNLGGQLIPQEYFDKLCHQIVTDKTISWRRIHQRYTDLADRYQRWKAQHAFAVLTMLNGGKSVSEEDWNTLLSKFIDLQNDIATATFKTRMKDLENPFYGCTYDTPEEKQANLGIITDDEVVVSAMDRYFDYQKKYGK
ncbi:MAG: DUF4954 family protein [Bacteroidales bacterium]|nr:DUF4954 family protein [Bacteroidales bacterium]